MNPLYIYNPKKEASERYYDEAVAASTMQGIYNRVHGPALYFLNDGISISKKWLDIFTSEGEWLHNREQQHVDGFIALAQLTPPGYQGSCRVGSYRSRYLECGLHHCRCGGSGGIIP